MAATATTSNTTKPQLCHLWFAQIQNNDKKKYKHQYDSSIL
jgi:hypothetical protein